MVTLAHDIIVCMRDVLTMGPGMYSELINLFVPYKDYWRIV